MFTLLGWIICGWVAGTIAQCIVPLGDDTPPWMTVALGIAGSIVGGIACAIVSGDSYSPAGILWSVVGSILVIAGYRYYVKGA